MDCRGGGRMIIKEIEGGRDRSCGSVLMIVWNGYSLSESTVLSNEDI